MSISKAFLSPDRITPIEITKKITEKNINLIFGLKFVFFIKRYVY